MTGSSARDCQVPESLFAPWDQSKNMIDVIHATDGERKGYSLCYEAAGRSGRIIPREGA
ncbi:hypothetical protein EFR01_17370 [Sinorhizobium fredii]|nr:hypothetical protein EFR01_17370 [Sinorhizobium fredii]GLS07155.1 hypothetical protein GCM10007864_07810 [Sinorhizobium fredii]